MSQFAEWQRSTIFRALFRDYEGPAFAIRLWDGWRCSFSKGEAPCFTLVVENSQALHLLLEEPSEIRLEEAFIQGDLGIEGDISSAFTIADHILHRHLTLWRQIRKNAAGTLFRLGRWLRHGRWHSLRRDLASTLYHWIEWLRRNCEMLLQQLPETLQRIELLYMAGSDAAFSSEDISTCRVLLSLPSEPEQPPAGHPKSLTPCLLQPRGRCTTNPPEEISRRDVHRLIAALDSLTDSELALNALIVFGPCAIPYLADFLLKGSLQAGSPPRCRVVRALANLEACSALISYFKGYEPPQDRTLLIAEDEVRSAAARELMRWRSEEVFQTLLEAAWQRATDGLVLALSGFHRPESIPLLFEVLEDDRCREYAKQGLLKVPSGARQYAILSIRGVTCLSLYGPLVLRRRRAVLQFLSEVGIAPADWPELRRFLFDSDPEVVVSAGQIGFLVAPEFEWPQITEALLNLADGLDFVQDRGALASPLRTSRESARNSTADGGV